MGYGWNVFVHINCRWQGSRYQTYDLDALAGYLLMPIEIHKDARNFSFFELSKFFKDRLTFLACWFKPSGRGSAMGRLGLFILQVLRLSASVAR